MTEPETSTARADVVLSAATAGLTKEGANDSSDSDFEDVELARFNEKAGSSSPTATIAVSSDPVTNGTAEGGEKDGKKKKDKKKEEKEEKVSFGELFRFADGVDVALIVFGSIGALLHGVFMPAFSLIFGELIDAFNGSRASIYDEISRIAPYFCYAGVGVLVVSYMQQAFWTMTSERQVKRVRERYLASILRQEISWFDTNDSGQLSARISGDTTLYQEAIGSQFGTFLQYFGTCIAGFVLGFVRGWQLTLVILALTPLLAASAAFMMKMLASLSTKGQVAYAKAGSVASEVLMGIRTVAAFGAEDHELERYTNNLDDARKVGYQKGLSSGLGMGLVMLVIYGVYGLALWYGSQLVINEGYTGGDVLTVFFSVIFGAFALGQMGPSMEAIGKGQGGAAKLFAVIDRTPVIDSASTEGKRPDNVVGKIELRDVDFRYPTRMETAVFVGMNMTIEAGKTYALVGQSGCGKSSTVSLIQRFYDPSAGQIALDGVNIKELNVQWLRSQIGLVGQEPVLFSGTIAENIAYGKPGASQAEIEQAAKMANAHNFVTKFPKGYETTVGEKGAQLSGGQKQRIAIARAIIKNPKILLLDEATSALDTESEKVVQEALDRVMKGRTTVVIAHRLSTVRNADQILVINQGKVVERGTHDELMAVNGIYTELVTLQNGPLAAEALHKRSKQQHHHHHHAASPTKKTETTAAPEGDAAVESDDVVVVVEPSADEEVAARCCGAKKTKKKSENEEEKEKTVDVPMQRLFALNKTEWPFLVIGCLASLLNAAINPAFSLVFSEIVTLFYKPEDQISEEVARWALLFFGIGVAAFCGFFFSSWMFGISGEKLTHRLRKLTFKAMLRQEVGWFDTEENAAGVLTARLATDASLVEGLLGTRIGITIQNIGVIIAALVIAFYYGWKLTLVILAASPAMMLGQVMQNLMFKGFGMKGRKQLAEANRVASEAIGNIRTVASFTSERRVLDAYVLKLAPPMKLNLRSSHVNGVLLGVGEMFLFFVYALGFWYGAVLIRDGEMEFIDVLKVFMAILMAGFSIGQASSLMPNTAKARLAASAIFTMIDRVPNIDAFSPAGDRLPDVKGDIEFRNVNFVYPSRPKAPIFEAMSFSAKAGQIVALVGPSGAGKSTSVALLERFYDPVDGHVLLDGVDIKTLNINWLRGQMGLVGQEPVLFQGTIAENIAYGKPGASQAEIEEAAKMANAYKFIQTFPDKFNTQVGEKGTQLSGGQKQRIAIARAIIRNPRILLLDEATSALDTESEKVVQKALNKVMKGRTTLVIAHRLSTIQNADRILVINQGKVSEQGTHAELMAAKGLYYTLVARQTGIINIGESTASYSPGASLGVSASLERLSNDGRVSFDARRSLDHTRSH